MIEREQPLRPFRVTYASRTKRWRRGDPVIGKYGLASTASRIKKTRTVIEFARDSVEILGRHHSRTLLVEPFEDSANSQSPEEIPTKKVHTYFVSRPYDERTFLLLVEDDKDPLRAAQNFFRTKRRVEVIPADSEEFCQRVRELHAQGIILNPKILNYAGIR